MERIWKGEKDILRTTARSGTTVAKIHRGLQGYCMFRPGSKCRFC